VPTRPFVPGHELAGDVAALGDGVAEPAVGARVAVNPARACGVCEACRAGRGNLCPRTVMLGSASTTPPTDGAFAAYVVVRADQCHALPETLDDGAGALLEPFAVGLHAIRRAGPVEGRSVLVLGGGTIGLTTILAARACGASTVVVGDPVETRRRIAVELGADAALDPTTPDAADRAGGLSEGGFHVVVEAAGAPAALRQALRLVRTGGTVVQVGTLGTDEIPLPAHLVMTRELQVVGSFRYGSAFGEAVRLAASGQADLKPLLSRVVPFADIVSAIEAASDREHAIKVQVDLLA
jgi:L-idonate 5-dehydrogenase